MARATEDPGREPVPRGETAPTARPKPEVQPRLSAESAAYNRQGPGYPLLQAPLSALGNLPADTPGVIDWVAALQQT